MSFCGACCCLQQATACPNQHKRGSRDDHCPYVTVAELLRLTTALALVVGSLGGFGCGDPVAPWELAFSDVQTVTFDQTEFQRRGTAAFVFTLPEEFADDTPEAYFVIDGSFVRSAPAPSPERVLIRATPRFSTIEGSVEAITFIARDGADTSLRIRGDLNRCQDSAECTRELIIDVGWLTPPSDPLGTLSLTLETSIEMRGGGTESEPGPPASASATIAVTLE